MDHVEHLSSSGLDARRRELGYSVAALARATGISYERLWRFFVNDVRLSVDELNRLDEVLMPAQTS